MILRRPSPSARGGDSPGCCFLTLRKEHSRCLFPFCCQAAARQQNCPFIATMPSLDEKSLPPLVPVTNTCTTNSTVHSGEPMSLSGLQSNEGEGPQAGIGDLKALPLEGLCPTGVMAPPSLGRWSPLPQPFPQGPVLLEQNSCTWLGRRLDTQVRVLWPYWHPPSIRNVDSQQAHL